jgi:hypothetical protein
VQGLAFLNAEAPVMNDITVCIVTIPPRAKKLQQGRPAPAWSRPSSPAAIVVEYDQNRTGTAATVTRSSRASTEVMCRVCVRVDRTAAARDHVEFPGAKHRSTEGARIGLERASKTREAPKNPLVEPPFPGAAHLGWENQPAD